MYYSIRHLTKFLYSNSVSESMMETRMHPRNDQNQRCLTFHLSVSPRCRVFGYRDHLANHVHHFDIPGQHGQLVIVAESLVEMQPLPQVPAFLAPDAWDELDAMVEQGDYWEMLLPSEFAAPTDALDELASELDVRRRDDPMMVLHQLNQQMYEHFDYKPKSTKVDSPIDLALSTKTGVCQDFAHIMTTLVRSKLRIPCRYVSGYLFHGESDMDRSIRSATHAWIEVLMPHLGWVGFDPTNWLVAGDRHIRTAIGRDYSDVPPTHGIFRGRAASELTVAVRVTQSEGAPSLDQELPVPEDWSILVERAQQLPEQLPPPTRQQQMAQQQQTASKKSDRLEWIKDLAF
ncbi:transglutaminase-like putative cysteine protease [Edaphobacter aggregans]|uniref:Transglutaminase-like putative cysteine protease n=1 Tax=Edaphobacter aggregans TaxID=570835 RepID=A0A3R9NY82_9BACT|nr:transglutaminase family protein [Edaphobacter aggregans]RSL17473.1 transglutaminase-like putative cysteine protease [Edaphobacter aggregans]